MTLGELLEKATSSDRIVILNAAKQVIFRGYTATVAHTHISPQRRVAKFGLGMETYRKADVMWDWQKTDALPQQVPLEQFSQFEIGELEHILYIRIVLENEFAI